MATAFELIIADDALVKGLKQQGAQTWYLKDTDPQSLKEQLAYLALRALPPATVAKLEQIFALTQACSAHAFMHLLCRLPSG